MMYQTEMRFFWPLTEQIPLELDFTGCERPKYEYTTHLYGTMIDTSCVPYVWGTTQPTASIEVNSDTITFGNLKMTWYRKILFKLMGFKWK